MSETKVKIIITSIKLFNKAGVNCVTMRDIAKELEMSSGNLAYHFRNKDAIIEAAFQQMEAERDFIFSGVQQIPSIDKIYNQTKYFIRLGKKYLFLYLDIVYILKTFPTIAPLHRNSLENSKKYIKGILDYSVGSENMRPEKVEGEYERLAHALWMIMTFWLNQLEIRELHCTPEEEEKLMHTLWDMIYPKLTQKGIDNYRKIFAESQGVKLIG